MRPTLASAVGDAKTVCFIGLCKNAGKTTALCRLLDEWGEESLAVTSIGRDGERRDVVTGTEKPEIRLKKGTLFATAKGLLPLCDATVEVLDVINVHTPLGQVAVLRALSDGYVQLAGPSAVEQLSALREQFFALGAKRVLIDGAAGRKSLAAAGEDGCAVLCVGAGMEGTPAHIAAETAHVCKLFDAPVITLKKTESRFALFDSKEELIKTAQDWQEIWNVLPDGGILHAEGGVTSPMLRALAQRGVPVTLAVSDATHFLFDRPSAQLFYRSGGKLAVEKKLTVAAVCANPWSPRGDHLDREGLLTALRNEIKLPVMDVKEGWT